MNIDAKSFFAIPAVLAAAILFASEAVSYAPTASGNSAATANLSFDGAEYKIDAAHSRFMVKALAGGLFSAFAHDHNIAIRDFGGSVRFTYDTVSPASLHLVIKSASLAITDKVSDSDREKIEKTMREEVLQAGAHPEIIFNSSEVEASKVSDSQYRARIKGDLSLRGVTKSVVINAQLGFGNGSLRAQGAFTLKQSEYGIKPVSVAGGTIKVKDELKFTFDIAAHS